MARPSLAELLNELRIPEPIQQALLDETYDTETLDWWHFLWRNWIRY